MFLLGENEENDFAIKNLYPIFNLKFYFFSKTYGFIFFLSNIDYKYLFIISEKYCEKFSKFYNPATKDPIKSVIYDEPVRKMFHYIVIYLSQLFCLL